MRFLYHAKFVCDSCGATATVEPVDDDPDKWVTPIPAGWTSPEIGDEHHGFQGVSMYHRTERSVRNMQDFCPNCMLTPFGAILAKIAQRMSGDG